MPQPGKHQLSSDDAIGMVDEAFKGALSNLLTTVASQFISLPKDQAAAHLKLGLQSYFLVRNEAVRVIINGEIKGLLGESSDGHGS